jgi:hypothetical protein
VKRRLLLLVSSVLVLLAGQVRSATAEAFSDSTVTDAWRLANGLEVRTRHVPGAGGVLVTIAYRAGSLYDPAGREGLAEVLAELQFTCAAGPAPARSRAAMDSLRSLGWGARVSPRMAVFTEVAAPGALAGLLGESAARMRGVTVTPASLAAAIASVRRDAGERALGRPDLGLYARVRDIATGTSDEAVITRAMGRALDAITVPEATALLREACVPANASLVLVGNLAGVDVHQLVEDAFGGIPAGTARLAPAEPVLVAGSRAAAWPGLEHALGSVGIFAPALDDSIHPAFLLASVFVGGYMREYAGPPKPPLSSRFQYSLFEEPDLVRVYPDVGPAETDPAALGRTMNDVFEQLGAQVIMSDAVDVVRHRVDWLLGGLMPLPLRTQSRQSPFVLEPLASAMASRALWRGDEFWARYRRSFETTRLMPAVFYRWMSDPRHQARLVLTVKP